MASFGALQALGILLVILAGVLYVAGADVNIELGNSVDQFGETISDFVAGALVIVGLARLRQGRTLDAYKWFDRSLLVEIFVGQVFAYIDQSFIATWGFLICVALLISVRFMTREEERMQSERGLLEPLGGSDVGGGPAMPRPAGASVP